ncbi:hypothetical protein DPEC_G00111120 [Dallia pectoralis]|uniref:Uncharacterized protein n=1 Tax=Dallia pectoralis TaxID=75939 RepID=A0ACC2GT82_DALPE|nr:hypothetical protein DPEC_G00111120 [Dallia pectoralis]
MEGARRKVKVESDAHGAGAGAYCREEQLATAAGSLEGSIADMKLSVSRMAELAGFPSRHSARSKGKMMGVSTSSSAGTQPNDVNKDGGALLPLATVKPPKFNGQGKWEVFFTQFELLANAGRWSDETKALQLALCLTEEASECLLTLAPGGRADYRALVEALGDRFGSDSQPNTLRIELGNRKRLPGESLKALASSILSMTRRAYGTMPLGVQDELARDSFIRALAPTECRHVQMAEPLSLRVAVEVARKRELIWGGGEDRQPEVRAVVAGGPEIVTPGWVDELSGLVRAATLVIEKGSRQRSNTSYTRMVCWRCGQSGHLQRDCDGGPRRQGNDNGSAHRGDVRAHLTAPTP